MSSAIVTQLTNDFIVGGEMLIKSLMHYNDISCDMIVLIDPTFTDENRKKIESLYKKITFHEVNPSQYNDSRSQYRGNREWSINPSDRFELFTFKQYDRIYYFDSDILVVKPLPKLFEYSGDFAAAPYSNKISVRSLQSSMNRFDTHMFNAGVMCISNKHLNTAVRDELVEICKTRKWAGNQPVLNHFFRKTADLLPAAYNLTMESATEQTLARARVLHFVGEKKIWNGSTVLDKFSPDIINRVGVTVLAKIMRIYREQCRILSM